MKKTIVIVTLIGLMSALSAVAAPKKEGGKAFERQYGLAGCGLGSVLMGKKGAQIFAGTTNGTFANQTFGITFGTLNCVDSETAAVASRMDTFVAANRAALASDMARGNGEALEHLAGMMGCDSSDAVGSAMQQNFHGIFPNTSVEPNEITDSVISVIKSNESLAASCKKIS